MKTFKPLQKSAFAVALMATIFLAACSENKPATDDHGPAKAVADGHADAHEVAGESITDFSDQNELFVELPALVVGQPATFAVHLTRLADFKPLDKGQVTVTLAAGDAPAEQSTASVSGVSGIFKPVLTPKAAGERELSIRVESDLGTQVHELGPVTVFTDAKAAAAGHDDHGHGEDGIPFSKEQQWKIDFATVEAVQGIARPSVNATATIKAQPDGEAQLAAPTAGIVRAASAFPRVGQQVKKGQVLATLSPRLGGETDQASLDAGASKARIGLDLARRERERMEALFKDEAIPEKRLIEARANERIALAEVDAAQARAAQMGGGAGIAIRTPIDGVIADVSVASGAFVAEGAALFHVANTQHLWLEARVPESEIGRLGQPTGAAFTVDGFDRPFTIDRQNGRLIAVGGVVDAATRTVPVIFEFSNAAQSGNALRLGMTAKAQVFSGGGKEAVLISSSAVQDESGTQVVYVQTGGESFERRIVQTGARDGEMIAVLSGLEPGQRVVSKGGYLIRLSKSMSAAVGHAH